MTLGDNIKAMRLYRDKFGCIVQQDGDGGDSANRMGSYYTYLFFLKAAVDDYMITAPNKGASEVIEMLEVSPGVYVRHPDPDKWYSRPDTFSRDQAIQVMNTIILYNIYCAGKRYIAARVKNKLLHFNTYESDTGKTKFPDIPSPIEISMFARLAREFTFLCYIFDTQLLFDVLVTRYFALKGGSKDFDANYLPSLIANTEVFPTFWGRLARKIYKTKADVPDRIRNYYAEGPGRNGLAPLAEIAAAAFGAL